MGSNFQKQIFSQRPQQRLQDDNDNDEQQNYKTCQVIFIIALIALIILLVCKKSSNPQKQLNKTVNEINATLDNLNQLYYKNCQGPKANSDGCQVLNSAIQDQTNLINKLQGLVTQFTKTVK